MTEYEILEYRSESVWLPNKEAVVQEMLIKCAHKVAPPSSW
jgi:hypothetical protein